MSDQPPDPATPGDPPPQASETTQESPPRLRSAPRPPNSPKPSVLMTQPLYEKARELYCQGTRSKAGLARALHIDRATARRLIEVGNPKRLWLPLKEQGRLHDVAQQEAAQAKTMEKARLEADEELRARKHRTTMLDTLKAAYAALFHGFWEGSQRASFSAEKVVVNGAQVEAVKGGLMTLYGHRLVAGFAGLAAIEDALLEKRPVTLPGGIPKGLLGLKPEQLDHIIEHGTLPPGVDEADVFGPPGKVRGEG